MPALTPLPDAPSRQDPVNFSARADALVAALKIMVEEINAIAPGANALELAGDLASPAAGKGAAMLGRGLPVVDSIAELRALRKTDPATRAVVTGYRAAGDGGGGSYCLDAADTTSTDNGGTVIVASDGGRWKLAQTDCITLRQFGLHPSRTGAQNSVCWSNLAAWIQQTYSTSFSSIDSAVGSTANNWLTVVDFGGIYKLGSTARLTAPANIRFAGQTATKFVADTGFTATSNNAIIDISRADGHWLLSQKIEGFTVIDGTNTFVPFYGKYLHQYHLDDIACVSGTWGFLIEGSYSGKIGRISGYKNTVLGKVVGLYSPSTQEANDIHIERIEGYDNGTGLQVGGGLNVYVRGVIQKTNLQAVEVLDNIALLDLTGLYLEDWYNSKSDYANDAYAVTTPSSANDIVGLLVAQKMTAVDNKPVFSLDQVLSAVITDNYFHTSTTVVHIRSTTALKSFEYRRNPLKRSGTAASPGASPQEFFGYIVKNDSTTIFPQLLASDLITGNSATNTSDPNYGYGFSGQLAGAKCAELEVDTWVPFPFRVNTTHSNLKRVIGRGRETGFTSSLPHYILDINDPVFESLRFYSTNTAQDAAVGDTGTAMYIGGTFNAVQRPTFRSVVWENGNNANAVEFGRNLKFALIESCLMVTPATNKCSLLSQDSTYINLRSDNDSTGTATTNANTLRNHFLKTPSVGTPSGTGNVVL